MAAPQSFERLRADFPSFVYEAFAHRWDGATLAVSFRFRCGEHVFAPTLEIVFPDAAALQSPVVPPAVLDNLVFHLGLAELPSYWKATCSPEIAIQTGPLDDDARGFWQWLLTEGMGEFHYKNQTPFTDPGFVRISSAARTPPVAVFPGALADGHVVPFGGGKDSLVSLDLLASRFPTRALVVNPVPSTEAALRIAGVEAVVVRRSIDPRLLALNEAGFLNGHTPFGAVVAFASACAAVLTGQKYVTLSNESSSDHATVRYRDRTINHQAGKSAAFEAKIHAYLARHVAGELHYFSLLRGFGELAIAQRFGELGAFHAVVRSCNRGRKTDSWCCACPKCLSTFLVLAPFVPRDALLRLFGKDLDPTPGACEAPGSQRSTCPSLLPALLGEPGHPQPFECVATPEEIRAALALAGDGPLSEATRELLGREGEAPLVPEALRPIVRAALRPRLGPLLRRGAAVGVVGLGIEGQSSSRYLLAHELGDSAALTVIDDDPAVAARLPAPARPNQVVRFVSGREAAEAPPALDIVFQAPGVPPTHPAIVAQRRKHAIFGANTELFFERAPGTIVGVTGTKGKSTATSLVAHVLSAAGKDARLLGNIGTSCLDGLDGAGPDTIHCVELSSFQLEHLGRSPHLAVVLGIFGDHLDRYPDLAAYAAAKSAIARFQTRADAVFFNGDCPRATAIAALSPGRKIAFGRERPALLGEGPSPLLGAFNHYNQWPAIHIARHFGVPDDVIAAALRSFQPLRGRLETVAHKDGVRFVCDIRSTAPEVTVAALEALADTGVDFLFLGGVDRRQDYRTLLPALERSRVAHVLLFPPTGARVRALIAGSGLASRVALFEPSSMADAIRYVYRHAPADGAVCLMSTAAPSNGGLFRGPEDKASQFAHYAAELGRDAAASA